MQTDGNLVLYGSNNQALWSSQSDGHANSSLALQTDGNLVVYSQSSQALWNTGTSHNPDNLGFVNTRGSSIKLYPGQQLSTADRRYTFILQTDGNLVLYSPTRALWASGTDGKNTAYFAVQSDGNLVLYNTNNQAIWNSRTSGFNNSNLLVQPDGNVVLYNLNGQAVWNTQTNGKS
jgi:exopolysaccharide biosynthesis protein